MKKNLHRILELIHFLFQKIINDLNVKTQKMDFVKDNYTNGKYTKLHINEVNHIHCCYST